jgi:hypothetical protein
MLCAFRGSSYDCPSTDRYVPAVLPSPREIDRMAIGSFSKAFIRASGAQGNNGNQGRRMSNWIGQSVSRVEDERLLKGQGRYLADVKIPGTLEAVFVRSIRSHAAIRGIDKRRALAAPGVVAVFTRGGLGSISSPSYWPKKILWSCC